MPQEDEVAPRRRKISGPPVYGDVEVSVPEDDAPEVVALAHLHDELVHRLELDRALRDELGELPHVHDEAKGRIPRVDDASCAVDWDDTTSGRGLVSPPELVDEETPGRAAPAPVSCSIIWSAKIPRAPGGLCCGPRVAGAVRYADALGYEAEKRGPAGDRAPRADSSSRSALDASECPATEEANGSRTMWAGSSSSLRGSISARQSRSWGSAGGAPSADANDLAVGRESMPPVGAS